MENTPEPRPAAPKKPHAEPVILPKTSLYARLLHLFKQIIGFGIVGVLAFIIDYSLLVFQVEILHTHYLIAATISFCVSVVFNYAASMRFVFKHKEDMSRRREIALFFVGAVIGLGINDLTMFVGTGLLGITYLITKIAATIVVAVWNFVTRKIFLDAS